MVRSILLQAESLVKPTLDHSEEGADNFSARRSDEVDFAFDSDEDRNASDVDMSEAVVTSQGTQTLD